MAKSSTRPAEVEALPTKLAGQIAEIRRANAAEREERRAVEMVLSARLTAIETLLAAHIPNTGPVAAGDGYCTVKQAAIQLRMTAPGVHYQIGRRKLKAKKIGGAVLIELASLENFIANKARGHC